MSFIVSQEIMDHQVRVAKLAREFSKQLGFTKKEATTLYLASLYHDIGKSKIDHKIYNKPGKLNNKEFKEIKKHSEESVKILKTLNVNEDILEIVLTHHESYNGQGYPRMLKAEEIPYPARILKVCDVYDALTNKRCYKPQAYSKEKALTVMENMISEFDPYIFNQFLIFIECVETQTA